jgi:hypothetical protein
VQRSNCISGESVDSARWCSFQQEAGRPLVLLAVGRRADLLSAASGAHDADESRVAI